MSEYILAILNGNLVLINTILNSIPSNYIKINNELVGYFRERICTHTFNGETIKEEKITTKEQIDKYLSVKLNMTIPDTSNKNKDQEIKELKDTIDALILSNLGGKTDV